MFLTAGTDTTANQAAWTLYELAYRPEVQARLQMEVDGAMAGRCGDGSGRDAPPTAEELVHMPYLAGVIKEAYRFHPVTAVGLMRRTAMASTLAGYAIPAGVPALLLFHPALSSAKLGGWEQPERFWPERWMTGTAVAGEKSLMMFSVGSRDCIGQSLALLELRTVLVELTRHFTFRLVADRPVVESLDLVLRSKTGIWLTCEPRPRAL